MSSAASLVSRSYTPLTPAEREVIARATAGAPPLRPAVVEELAALFGGAR